ncbi:phage terminase small subunit [Faucicola boevrei]|uniref:phage terminase small subunit n=1 Tax=Faucicola boevrei TaxID=346665 RepID=UPI0003824794|nr:phage terminase small subunit [Moraxella boevrei]
MSSLKQHFERVQAEKQARKRGETLKISPQNKPLFDADDSEETDNPDDSNPLELKFFNDWQQLSNLQSHSKKNELKAEFLPHYIPYIEGVIASGVGVQNDMLLILMVWALDVHEFGVASNIAEFALLNDMAMPEPFSRDVATVYAENLANEVLTHNLVLDKELLQKAIDITQDYDMPDPVRAKLYRVFGDSLKADELTQAITAYETALKLDEKVGVKTLLTNLKKQLEI